MGRNFGQIKSRPAIGGKPLTGSHLALDTRRNSIWLTGYPPGRPDWDGFGRSSFYQAMIDLAAVASIVVLSCATGVGIAAAGFILLFVPL